MALAYGFPNDTPVLNGDARFIIPLLAADSQLLSEQMPESEPETAAEDTPW
jgi:hypothetical protein